MAAERRKDDDWMLDDYFYDARDSKDTATALSSGEVARQVITEIKCYDDDSENSWILLNHSQTENVAKADKCDAGLATLSNTLHAAGDSDDIASELARETDSTSSSSITSEGGVSRGDTRSSRKPQGRQKSDQNFKQEKSVSLRPTKESIDNNSESAQSNKRKRKEKARKRTKKKRKRKERECECVQQSDACERFQNNQLYQVVAPAPETQDECQQTCPSKKKTKRQSREELGRSFLIKPGKYALSSRRPRCPRTRKRSPRKKERKTETRENSIVREYNYDYYRNTWTPADTDGTSLIRTESHFTPLQCQPTDTFNICECLSPEQLSSSEPILGPKPSSPIFLPKDSRCGQGSPTRSTETTCDYFPQDPREQLDSTSSLLKIPVCDCSGESGDVKTICLCANKGDSPNNLTHSPCACTTVDGTLPQPTGVQLECACTSPTVDSRCPDHTSIVPQEDDACSCSSTMAEEIGDSKKNGANSPCECCEAETQTGCDMCTCTNDTISTHNKETMASNRCDIGTSVSRALLRTPCVAAKNVETVNNQSSCTISKLSSKIHATRKNDCVSLPCCAGSPSKSNTSYKGAHRTQSQLAPTCECSSIKSEQSFTCSQSTVEVVMACQEEEFIKCECPGESFQKIPSIEKAGEICECVSEENSHRPASVEQLPIVSDGSKSKEMLCNCTSNESETHVQESESSEDGCECHNKENECQNSNTSTKANGQYTSHFACKSKSLEVCSKRGYTICQDVSQNPEEQSTSDNRTNTICSRRANKRPWVSHSSNEVGANSSHQLPKCRSSLPQSPDCSRTRVKQTKICKTERRSSVNNRNTQDFAKHVCGSTLPVNKQSKLKFAQNESCNTVEKPINTCSKRWIGHRICSCAIRRKDKPGVSARCGTSLKTCSDKFPTGNRGTMAAKCSKYQFLSGPGCSISCNARKKDINTYTASICCCSSVDTVISGSSHDISSSTQQTNRKKMCQCGNNVQPSTEMCMASSQISVNMEKESITYICSCNEIDHSECEPPIDTCQECNSTVDVKESETNECQECDYRSVLSTGNELQNESSSCCISISASDTNEQPIGICSGCESSPNAADVCGTHNVTFSGCPSLHPEEEEHESKTQTCHQTDLCTCNSSEESQLQNCVSEHTNSLQCTCSETTKEEEQEPNCAYRTDNEYQHDSPNTCAEEEGEICSCSAEALSAENKCSPQISPRCSCSSDDEVVECNWKKQILLASGADKCGTPIKKKIQDKLQICATDDNKLAADRLQNIERAEAKHIIVYPPNVPHPPNCSTNVNLTNTVCSSCGATYPNPVPRVVHMTTSSHKIHACSSTHVTSISPSPSAASEHLTNSPVIGNVTGTLCADGTILINYNSLCTALATQPQLQQWSDQCRNQDQSTCRGTLPTIPECTSFSCRNGAVPNSCAVTHTQQSTCTQPPPCAQQPTRTLSASSDSSCWLKVDVIPPPPRGSSLCNQQGLVYSGPRVTANALTSPSQTCGVIMSNSAHVVNTRTPVQLPPSVCGTPAVAMISCESTQPAPSMYVQEVQGQVPFSSVRQSPPCTCVQTVQDQVQAPCSSVYQHATPTCVQTVQGQTPSSSVCQPAQTTYIQTVQGQAPYSSVCQPAAPTYVQSVQGQAPCSSVCQEPEPTPVCSGDAVQYSPAPIPVWYPTPISSTPFHVTIPTSTPYHVTIPTMTPYDASTCCAAPSTATPACERAESCTCSLSCASQKPTGIRIIRDNASPGVACALDWSIGKPIRVESWETESSCNYKPFVMRREQCLPTGQFCPQSECGSRFSWDSCSAINAIQARNTNFARGATALASAACDHASLGAPAYLAQRTLYRTAPGSQLQQCRTPYGSTCQPDVCCNSQQCSRKTSLYRPSPTVTCFEQPHSLNTTVSGPCGYSDPGYIAVYREFKYPMNSECVPPQPYCGVSTTPRACRMSSPFDASDVCEARARYRPSTPPDGRRSASLPFITGHPGTSFNAMVSKSKKYSAGSDRYSVNSRRSRGSRSTHVSRDADSERPTNHFSSAGDAGSSIHLTVPFNSPNKTSSVEDERPTRELSNVENRRKRSKSKEST